MRKMDKALLDESAQPSVMRSSLRRAPPLARALARQGSQTTPRHDRHTPMRSPLEPLPLRIPLEPKQRALKAQTSSTPEGQTAAPLQEKATPQPMIGSTRHVGAGFGLRLRESSPRSKGAASHIARAHRGNTPSCMHAHTI